MRIKSPDILETISSRKVVRMEVRTTKYQKTFLKKSFGDSGGIKVLLQYMIAEEIALI